MKTLAPRRPTECLTAGVEFEGRRFFLCLVASHYSRAGVAIFTEVTTEDGADGEPKHDIFQDVGDWSIDSSDDGPSVLKVDLMPADDLTIEQGAAVVNALLAQFVASSGSWGIQAAEAWVS